MNNPTEREKQIARALIAKWERELPNGNVNGRSAIGYITEFVADLRALTASPSEDTFPQCKSCARQAMPDDYLCAECAKELRSPSPSEDTKRLLLQFARYISNHAKPNHFDHGCRECVPDKPTDFVCSWHQAQHVLAAMSSPSPEGQEE